MRGSVVIHRRRCGKPNCRCAEGEVLHERVVFSYSEASRTRFLTLPEEIIDAVRLATARYRNKRACLEAEGNAGLAELVSSLRPGP